MEKSKNQLIQNVAGIYQKTKLKIMAPIFLGVSRPSSIYTANCGSAVSISLHTIWSYNKKVFIILFRWFPKFYKNYFFGDNFFYSWAFINLARGHVRSLKKFGPNRFCYFVIYWIQTYIQEKYIYRLSYLKLYIQGWYQEIVYGIPLVDVTLTLQIQVKTC